MYLEKRGVAAGGVLCTEDFEALARFTLRAEGYPAHPLVVFSRSFENEHTSAEQLREAAALVCRTFFGDPPDAATAATED